MIKPIASTLVVMSLLLSSSAAYCAGANANVRGTEGPAAMGTHKHGHTGEERREHRQEERKAREEKREKRREKRKDKREKHHEHKKEDNAGKGVQ